MFPGWKIFLEWHLAAVNYCDAYYARFLRTKKLIRCGSLSQRVLGDYHWFDSPLLLQIADMNIAIVFFVLAILLVTRLPELPVVPPFFTVLPLALYGLRSRLSLPPSAFCLGLLFVLHHAESELGKRLPESLEARNLQVTGLVVGLPSRKEGIEKFRFYVEQIDQCQSCWTGITSISWYRSPVRVQPGDRYRFTVKLSRPGASLNPGLFDYEGWLFAQGIQATGYVREKDGFKKLGTNPLAVPHHAMRYWVRERMQGLLEESPVRGLLIALTIGETNQISHSDWRRLTKTGTNHLLIISGLHVGLVAAMIFRVLRYLPLSIRLLSLVTIVLTAFYALLAGFGLPVQRALMMTSVVLIAICINRKVNTLTMFLASLLGVVVLQPFALLSIGFWLSFGAVFALLYAFTGRKELAAPKGILLLAAIRTQWIVFVAMFPLLLHLVFQASLIAFLVNMIAIPFISMAVIPFLLVFVVMMPVSAVIAQGSLTAAEFFLSIFWQAISWVSNLDWVFHGIALDSTPFLVSLAGVLIFFSPKGLVPRWLGLLCFLPLFGNGATSTFPGKSELHITFIDVGQGLSVLLRTMHSAVLYDAGPRFGDRFDTGEQIITPLLRQLGVRHLDAFVVSHGDNDHAGGMQAVIRNFEINREYSSFNWAPLVGNRSGKRNRDCHLPHSWRVDGINFEIFNLVGDETEDGVATSENDRSCMLLVFTEDFAVLMTGDIEAPAESILRDRLLPDIDVISVPHHGSRTSSTPGFINHLQPRLAIVSAGFRNRFNHPEPAVLRRYRQRHVRVLNTAEQGAISLWLGKGGILKIELTRPLYRRFWHRKPSTG